MSDLSKYMTLRQTWDHPCWRFLELIFIKEYGIEVPTFPLTKRRMAGWNAVDMGKERSLDILVFRISKWQRHVGLCLGSNEMLHYGDDIGAAVERYNGLLWKDRLVSVYRYGH